MSIFLFWLGGLGFEMLIAAELQLVSVKFDWTFDERMCGLAGSCSEFALHQRLDMLLRHL